VEKKAGKFLSSEQCQQLKDLHCTIVGGGVPRLLTNTNLRAAGCRPYARNAGFTGFRRGGNLPPAPQNPFVNSLVPDAGYIFMLITGRRGRCPIGLNLREFNLLFTGI